MKQNLLKFMTGLLIITILLGIIGWFIHRYLAEHIYCHQFPGILTFFFLVNSLFFLAFIKINASENQAFIRKFLWLFAVKFLAYLMSGIAIILVYRQDALKIAVTAMVIYIIYTVYEVFWLSTILKRNNLDQ
jgi:hypothetical protein